MRGNLFVSDGDEPNCYLCTGELLVEQVSVAPHFDHDLAEIPGQCQ